MIWIAAIALALTTVAELLPVPKSQGPGGSCPHGYTTRA
jgi:hypothetical protein